jgi:hypothetical protein
LDATPASIRQKLLGASSAEALLVVDAAWTAVAADLGVGEQALLPLGATLEGSVVEAVADGVAGDLVRAVRPGLTRACLPGGWACWLRVSRKDYCGRGGWRHLEDPDGE